MQVVAGAPGVQMLDGVLTPAECAQVIADGEALGFASKVSRRSGPPIRDNDRALYDPGDVLAAALEQRLQAAVAWALAHALPPGWRVPADGHFLNRRWRLNRYDTGEAFKPHFDSGHAFHEARRTLLSLIIYLNEDFEGGDTVFLDDEAPPVYVRPRTGAALVFPHFGPGSPLHATSPLRAVPRPKYIARTDLIFERDDFTLARLLFCTPAEVRKAVLLLGVPGAGKSSQLELLRERLGWSTFNFGHHVRQARVEATPLGAALRSDQRVRAEARRSTAWLPERLSRWVFRERLPSASHEPLLLDGYPRRRAQSLELEVPEWLLLCAIHLRVSPRTQAVRLEERARAGRPMPDLDVRMADWERETWPLAEQFHKRGQLDEVDADLPPRDVADAIAAIVQGRLFELLWRFVPPAGREALDGYEPVRRNLSRKHHVYGFRGRDEERFLKVVHDEDASQGAPAEVRLLSKLTRERFPLDVPQVVTHVPMGPGVTGIVTRRVPGITLKEAWQRGLIELDVLVDRWAAALARIHAFSPSDNARFDRLPLEVLQARARRRLAAGAVSPQAFSARYGAAPVGLALEQELAEASAACDAVPYDDLRPSHGDPCAPNLVWSMERQDVTGCLDLSGFAVIDVHWDLGLALWSLQHNVRLDRTSAFLDAYARARAALTGVEPAVSADKAMRLYRLARFIL